MPGSEKAYANSGLGLGGEIVRVADGDLAAASELDTNLQIHVLRKPDAPLEITYRRGGRTDLAQLPLLNVPVPWGWPMCCALSYAGVALALLLRAPTSRTARATAYAFVAYSFSWLVFRGHDRAEAL